MAIASAKAEFNTTPAEAGAHFSATRASETWTPTFVGVVGFARILP
jgi:hypothetical protein